MDCLENPLIWGFAHTDCFDGFQARKLEDLRCEVEHIKFVTGDKLGVVWNAPEEPAETLEAVSYTKPPKGLWELLGGLHERVV